jgi:hypothetical protein
MTAWHMAALDGEEKSAEKREKEEERKKRNAHSGNPEGREVVHLHLVTTCHRETDHHRVRDEVV